MYDEDSFQQALSHPRLRQPLPEFLPGNRAGGAVRVRTEDELNASTRVWFDEFAAKLRLYEGLGLDLGWLMDWTKKYWWSFLVRDMSINAELYAEDIRYKDPTTFGREIVGIEEFVKYNFAFFDAIPDWRYDPIPGQAYIDVTPGKEVRLVVRYLGSGHFDGVLRLYPYDETAPKLHGVGTFVQCAAVDRYHFDAEGRMYEGETLFDFIDATQSAGVLPRDDSWQFHALMRASAMPGALHRLRSRLSRA